MIKVCKCKCVCRLFSFQSLLRMSIKAIHSSNNLCHFVRWFASFNALKPIILHDNLPHFISLFIINHIVTIKVLTYYSVWGVLLIACGWWGTSLPWLNDYIWKECSMYWVFLKNAGRLWGGWGLFISWIWVFSPAFYPNTPSIINHITPLSLRRGAGGEAIPLFSFFILGLWERLSFPTKRKGRNQIPPLLNCMLASFTSFCWVELSPQQ